MALAENRVKSGQKETPYKKISLFLNKGILICVLIASFCLTKIVDNISSDKLLEISGHLHNTIHNVARRTKQYFGEPLRYFESLEQLKDENQQLQQKIIDLHNKLMKLELAQNYNVELKELLNFVSSLQTEYISTKLVSIIQAPEGEYGIIDCGSKQEINLGDLVVANGGLIGKIIQVSTSYSKVLLITNSKFRMPIITSSGQKGIFVGDTSKPYILYLADEVKEGEKLFTSREGGILIENVPVAQVSSLDDKIYAQPISTLQDIDFVSVLIQKRIE